MLQHAGYVSLIASPILAIAFSLVLPCEWHPGKAGQLTTIYPFSSCSKVIANFIIISPPHNFNSFSKLQLDYSKNWSNTP
jgi:hypothetical protein